MMEPTCPICGRRLVGPIAGWPRLPFCSDKCKMVDLGRWLDERYRVAKEEEDEESLDEETDIP